MSADTNVDANDVRAVERILLRFEEGLLPNQNESNILFEVQNLSSWIIKFRTNGILINNCELVFPEKDISATILFKSHTIFWGIINNKETFEDAISKGGVILSGSDASIDIFKSKLLGSDMSSKEFNVSPAPIRSRALSNGEVPLKSGWLLKKRDLFSGWRCRYFVVYYGRMDYFIDQHDIQSRGTVPLYGAEVSVSRKMTISGVSDHWGMTVELGKVEPKQKEKSFKLASELTGDEGMADAATWVKVFQIASKRGNDKASPAMMLKDPSSRTSSRGIIATAKPASPSIAPSNLKSEKPVPAKEARSSAATSVLSVASSTIAAASSKSPTVAAIVAATTETASSTVTLSLPGICCGLLALFFAGWFAGSGMTEAETIVTYLLSGRGFIVGLLVSISVASFLASGMLKVSRNSAEQASENVEGELLVRPTRSSGKSKSKSTPKEDVDST